MNIEELISATETDESFRFNVLNGHRPIANESDYQRLLKVKYPSDIERTLYYKSIDYFMLMGYEKFIRPACVHNYKRYEKYLLPVSFTPDFMLRNSRPRNGNRYEHRQILLWHGIY